MISKYTLNNTKTSYGNRAPYFGSEFSDYLDRTVYNGFVDDVKTAIFDNLSINRGDGVYNGRSVAAPSGTELGIVRKSSTHFVTDGSIYPIFSPASEPNTKAAYKTPSGIDADYITRSHFVTLSGSYSSELVVKSPSGYATGEDAVYSSFYAVACIRFAKK